MNPFLIITDTEGQKIFRLDGLQYAIADSDDFTIELVWGNSNSLILDFATGGEMQSALSLIVNKISALHTKPV